MKRNSTYVMSKIVDPRGRAEAAQVGVDLTVDEIQRITQPSVLNAEGKISIGEYEFPQRKRFGSPETGTFNNYWVLSPGCYAITFQQGLKKLAADENAYIIQRSSLNRAGVRIEGSIFDPGFETDKLGATMFVWAPITVFQGARIAQITIETNEPVESEMLYEGQWQGKTNR